MTLFHLRVRAAAVVVIGAGVLAGPAAAQQRPFAQVVGQLTSPDAGTRLSALRLLAESGYPEAAGPVAPLLSDPDTRIQREAFYAEVSFFLGGQAAKKGGGVLRAFDQNWGAMPTGRVPIEVVTGLLTPLKDPSAAVRAEAAYALGLLGQIEGVTPGAEYKPVVEALADRLGDADRSVRLAVARASGRVFRRCPAGCGPLAVERVGDALVRLLNDPEMAVQGAAMEGLGEIRYERAVTALGDVLGYYKTGEMGFAALDTLARIGHPSSVPLFKTALASKDPNFRRAAVEGLARSGNLAEAIAADAVIGADPDPSVGLALAFSQQRTGRAPQVPRLVQALSDRSLRTQAQDYLVELGPAAAAELAGALAASAPEVRTALLEVLGVTGGPQQESAIEALASGGPDPKVSVAAQRALARIRSLK